VDQLHLCPVPVKVHPISFSKTTVDFTCVSKAEDKYVMERLCKIYGIKQLFRE
jgi:hypothetical protein